MTSFLQALPLMVCSGLLAVTSTAAAVPCGQDLRRDPLEFVVRGDNWLQMAATRVLPGMNRRVLLGQPATTREQLSFGPGTRMRINGSGRMTAKTSRNLSRKLSRINQAQEQMVASWPELVRDVSRVPEGVSATFVLPPGGIEVTSSAGHLLLGGEADTLSPEVTIRGNGAVLRVKDGEPLYRLYGSAAIHFEGPMVIERGG